MKFENGFRFTCFLSLSRKYKAEPLGGFTRQNIISYRYKRSLNSFTEMLSFSKRTTKTENKNAIYQILILKY